MKRDLISIIRDTSKFLGYHLTELKILILDDYLHIDNLRKIGAQGLSGGDPKSMTKMQKFFRKGKVGDWKNFFEGEMLQNWDRWINKQVDGSGIPL